MSVIYNFKENIKETEIKYVGEVIRSGGVVVFPTETVYGIGANALDEESVLKIFKAKGRPSDNPLIVHIADIKMLEDIVEEVSETENKLMNKFWPGPLTIILKRKGNISNSVTAGLDTVGVRMPNNNIALSIIKEAGVPIAAPSANISGKPSGTRIEDIFEELNGRVDIMIDGGFSEIGLESTVIKVEGEEVNILRPGKISREEIEELGIMVKMDSHIFSDVKEDEIVASPGMKHKHYAPKTQTILLEYDSDENMINKMKKFLSNNISKKIAIICFEEHRTQYEKMGIICISNGSKNDLNEISRNIFTNLRKVDNLNVDICVVEGVENKEAGTAIMNRLIRACEYSKI